MAGWIVAAVVVIVAVVLIYHGQKKTGNEGGGNHVTPQNNRPVQQTQNTPLAQRSETGPMVYYANDNHGRSDREYRFNYKRIDGAWRAYILRMPSLGNRDARSIPTHRLWDDNNNPYICWQGRITSLHDMQNISREWADCIQEYIATGKRFGPE